jgi:hypothetical protein
VAPTLASGPSNAFSGSSDSALFQDCAARFRSDRVRNHGSICDLWHQRRPWVPRSERKVRRMG